jgi:hypothetical protein
VETKLINSRYRGEGAVTVEKSVRIFGRAGEERGKQRCLNVIPD